MGIWSSVKGFASRWIESRRAFTTSSKDLSDLFGSQKSQSGIDVTEDSALNYSSVWAAVRLISETIASLPLLTYRRTEGGKERAVDLPIYEILHSQWNGDMSAMQARETMQAHVLTWGNSYAEIVRNGFGRVVELWPMTPDIVAPKLNKAGRIEYEIQDGFSKSILPAQDVLHVPGLGFDGLVGYSVIRMARECIGLGLAAEAFGGGFFGNGSRVGGIISHPGRPDDPTLKTSKESWEKIHKGPHKQGGTAVLFGGLKFEPFAINNNDSQFLETRRFQVAEIARWFNLPVHLLRDLEKGASYASIEQQSIDFVVYTLRPWMVRWEQEINRKLLTPIERKTFFVEHLIDGLLRGDAKTRAEALQIRFMNGNLSIDEWRAIENQNPLPDGLGKKYYVQLNMAPVDAAKAEPTINAARMALLDSLMRMARKDAEATRRAAAKPGEFLLWIDRYWDDGSTWMRAVAPPFEVALALKIGNNAIDSVCHSRAKRAREELLALADGDPKEFTGRVCKWANRWEAESPAVLLQELVR